MKNNGYEQKMLYCQQAREAAQDEPFRTIRCPQCGFPLMNFYGTRKVILEVKCPKCKFSDFIDTRHFKILNMFFDERCGEWKIAKDDIFPLSTRVI